jgi:formylglycine-generating enzyme required for sulfatase activity
MALALAAVLLPPASVHAQLTFQYGFLNFYFGDGVSPSPIFGTSPYAPNQTVNLSGTPLTAAGQSWLMTSGAGAPTPGFATTPYTYNSGASSSYANVAAKWVMGGNNTGLSNNYTGPGNMAGTSIDLVNTGPGAAEVRMDWIAHYKNNSGQIFPLSTIMNVFVNGTLGTYTAVASAETWQLAPGGNPVTYTASLPIGGDWSSPAGYPSGVNPLNPNGAFWGYDITSPFQQYVFASAPPYGVGMAKGDSLTVTGYLDLIIDPGSAHIEIMGKPSLAMTKVDALPVLTWPAEPTNYILESTADLANGPWVPNTSPFTTANGTNSITISPAVSSRFYRLSLVLNTNTPLVAPSNMVLIPAGSFTMGDTLDGEGDATPTVTADISDFFMDTNLVSYSQWQGVYNWAVTNGYSFDSPGNNAGTTTGLDTLPVAVEWYEVAKWCNARSQQAGLAPVYYLDLGLTELYIAGDSSPIYADWSANGYRMPTEAEWEKAARGGLVGYRFPWGNDISQSQANYAGCQGCYGYDLGPNSSPSGPVPVGSYAPNNYGLYDMAGNSAQWCSDYYATPYVGGTDPRGPGSGAYHVLRNGNWNFNADSSRCAYRGGLYADAYAFGFRCVKTP